MAQQPTCLRTKLQLAMRAYATVGRGQAELTRAAGARHRHCNAVCGPHALWSKFERC